MKKAILGLMGATILTAFVSNSDYKALELSYMDTSVSPADDFYNYVNGKWMKQTVIPNDRSRWGSFDELGKRADSMSLAVLEESIKSNKYAAKTDQGKAVMLFETVLDIENRNKQGIDPIKPYLIEINALNNLDALKKYIVKYATAGENTMFDLGVDADAKNSNRNVVSIGITGLGLPDRDYYLKTDEKSAGIQEKYRKFIEDVFMKFGTDPLAAKTNAIAIYNFEKSLAVPMLTREQRRDPVAQYNLLYQIHSRSLYA
jgi:predicted metalloendopeptidase